jgi:hypothetical protein
MAFTASWIASVPLELVDVEPEELDCPRSWLSDSVLELPPKLDSSELMELVLIPLLPCAAAANRSSGATLANYGIGKFHISLSLWHGVTAVASQGQNGHASIGSGAIM